MIRFQTQASIRDPGDNREGRPTMLAYGSNSVIQVSIGPTRPAGPAAPLRRCRAIAPGDGDPETGLEKIGQFGNGGVFHRECRPATMYNCLIPPFQIQSYECGMLKGSTGSALLRRNEEPRNVHENNNVNASGRRSRRSFVTYIAN